ncbi:MAG: hypothetical protein IIW10_02455 [Spirochaetaceae bacterium]|nr:hypothetical protein [Spirochaetaceae bacterium]
MNKKILALALACIVGTSSLFAWGIGIQGGGAPGANFGGGGAITFKTDNLPVVWAVDLGFGSQWFSAGVTADWWILNKPIVGIWNWYFGVGAYVGVNIWNNDYFGINVGGRIPIGMNWMLFNNKFEIYLQAAAQLGASIGISAGYGDHFDIFHWSVPINLGIRFWF